MEGAAALRALVPPTPATLAQGLFPPLPDILRPPPTIGENTG